MFKATAKVIEDTTYFSAADAKLKRITTLQLMYPRFIHAEFMTHRVFSRNASSSRAIPVAKVIEQVRKDPAMPLHWGKNQPGMQAHEQLEEPQLSLAITEWRQAARYAADFAEGMNSYGLHKQVANRILEPFQFMHVVVTATEWENFFILRDHPDAQPEIRALAVAMKAALDGSDPRVVVVPTLADTSLERHWHLPYVMRDERHAYADDAEYLCKLSAARCARVSYLTHDGKQPDPEKDVALYAKLIESEPMHASPIEHQAVPLNSMHFGNDLQGNFKGWIQYRKLVENGVVLA